MYPNIKLKLTIYDYLLYVICLQIQFSIILFQCCLGIARDCDVPRVLIAIYAPNVLLIFYMFYDFFNKAYKRKNIQMEQQKLHQHQHDLNNNIQKSKNVKCD